MDYEDARETGPEAETSQLVSEIAAAAVAAAKTGGVPLLPDAQNVVILPAGATLDDIRVSGRDLVIQLADGRLFVIPDGAVFVPQIVLDGVTVPPLNLAALLIGQQPQPAAGAVQSSGGNFAEPTGPIQDAFDLGNLLPYTELAFPEQPEREVIVAPVNNTPTTIIITPNNPAGAVAASATVNEKGLPPHGALPAGSGEIADGNPANNSDTTETTTGTIDITSLDGIRAIALNGAAITAVGQTIAGASGTLTITSIDLTAQTVGYSYTLTTSTLGDATSDNFAVTVTDNDGDTASATLMVNIVDDVPTARNDTDALAAGTFGPETGNVITGEGTTSAPGGADTPGADGASLTRIASSNVPANIDTSFDGAGNLVVDGQYGVLSIKADGSYSYTRNTNTPGGVNDVFSYTLTDGDTDTSTATLTIAIGDADPAIANLTPKADGGDALVDEDDLADGSDTAKESLTATGTFTIASPDGIASLVVDGRTVIANGAFTAASWTTPLGNTIAITGYDPATGVVTYTYTLLDNENHPSAAGENALFEDFAVALTDLDGDTASSTLSVNIVDDVPTARNDTDSVPNASTTATGNVITGADTTSGIAGADTLGADGGTVTGFRAGTAGNFAATGATVTGQFGTLTLNANGSYTYTRNSTAGNGSSDVFSYQITDGDGDTSIATLTIAIPDRPATVTSVPTTGGGTVVNESGLPPTGSNPAGTGEIADGDPDNESNQSEITSGTITFSTPDGFGSLTINGTVITGVGQVIQLTQGDFIVTGFDPVNGTLNYDFVLDTNTIGNNAQNGGNTSIVLTVQVFDIDGDNQSKPFTITIIDDAPIARDDSYTQTAENADVTGNVTGNDTPGADGPAAGGPVALVAGSLSGTGQLTLNPNGSFTYKPGTGELGPVTFQYTYTDGDGDSDPALVTITLVADSVPVGGQTSASVDDDGLSGATGTGNPASTTDDLTVPNGDGDANEATFGGTLAFTPSGDVPNVLSFAGMNGLTGSVGTETVTYGWNAGTNTLTATGPRGVLFTVQITDVNSGAYKVTLLDNVLHAGGPNNENAADPTTQLTYTIKDSDSPAVTGTLTIAFDDDAPSATAEASQNVAEGATLTGTFDFVQGADGATVTHIGGTALSFGGDGFSQLVTLGTLGAIKVKATGEYEFKAANPVNNPQTVTGAFTVTDNDGDTAQAGFSFVITDANVPRGGATAAAVDDDGLSGATGTGNPASTTDDLNANSGDAGPNTTENIFEGTLDFTPSADIPNVLSFAGMNGLTGSVGTETVTYGWNVGTNTLTATGPRGALFTVQITDVNTGTYKLTLLDNVLHAGGPNNENAVDPTTALTYTIADSDSPAVTGTLTIAFDDDAPTASALAGGDVAEGATVTGALVFVQGADGASVTHINGTALVFNAADANYSQAVDIGPGSIKVRADGSYSFTAETGLVNPALANATFRVTDGDGDTVTANIAFTITDAGSPSAPARAASVDDDGLGGNNAASTVGDLDANLGETPSVNASEAIYNGNLGFSYGLDGPAAAALDFLFTSTTGTVGQETVAYGWNDATSTLTATITASPDVARVSLTLFTVVVDQTGGNYTLTLARNVLHATGPNDENDATTVLTYRVQDSDGTQASNTLTITFDDDAPTATTALLTGTVDEDGLPGGIAGGAGDVAGEALVATGSVTSLFQPGADGPLTFSLTAAPAGLPALKSAGVDVTYAIAGNTLTASAGAGNTVFTFQLLANGNYTFTLVKQLDHPTANTEDNLAIALGAMIQATDKDGDPATAAAGGLTISVNDDLPQAGTGSQTGTVDEDGLAGGVAGGAGDVAGAATTASGSVVSLFQSGADQPLSYQLLNSTGGLPALTSGGVAVTYAVAGNVLTASAGAGNTVFTLTLNATTGAWDFALLKPLDHAATGVGADAPGQENDIVLNLGALLQATDKDGDTAAPGGPLTITIDDDTPIATAALLTGTVDEDGLPGGIAGGAGDVAGEALVATGSVTTLFQPGADTPLTYGLAAAPTGLPALTSAGVAVTYAIAGDTLTASAGAGNTVFTFQLLTNGNYTFTLVKQLDHATSGTEDNLAIALGAMIKATDRDGDTVTAAGNGLIVSVNDDLPAANTGSQSGTVDEDGLPGGTVGGPGDVAGISTTASGSVTGLFLSGADQPLTYQLLNSTGGLPSLFSGGVAVTYAVAGNVLTASAGAGNPVFTLTLNGSTGAWNFALLKPLDHAATGVGPDAPGQENDIVINFGALLQATDRDGDISAPGGPLTILIDDDTPTAVSGAGTAPALLDETAGTGGAAVIATTTPKGDDPDVPGAGAIAKATTASPILAATGVYGADGAGTLVYALTITNAASGLLVSDGTLAGSAITLVNEGGVIVGRVTAGAFANQAAFAISIAPATGIVSVEQYLSIRHPVTTNPDDQVSLAAGSLGATVTVTDRDGDPVTPNVVDVSGLFRFDDDGPAITSVTTPLAIANSGTISATGAFVIATGADGQGVGNDTIKTVTFNATVNGNAVTSPTIVQVSEDANTAVFNISFVYNNSPTTTVTETGTVTFNKAAGTYTVDLADPIQGFSISETATGSLFQGYQLGSATTDNTQPAVSVTQITPNLFIQFTGVDGASSTANYNLVTPATGDGVGGTFANGELFSATASWVSVSNTANGVAGDTIGGDEILNFNLYNTNPTGTVGTPTANADAMFLKFDGIGAAEDFIVILKLFNPATGVYSTKALMVQNGDIQKGPGAGPGVYSGITLDNNDGLVIIESNDYNSGAEAWKIVGAQIVVDPLAITGTAIDFNNTTGAGGASSGTQAFSADTNTGAPMKISSIGFVTNTTTAQSAVLTFGVTVQDGDGDTVQQTLVVNVSPVVLDLDGDGVEFLARSAGVTFDYLGNGAPLSTAWAGKDDGILAIDLDGNGKVDSGKEIVFGGNGLTDLQGIAARYDSNHDGVLDASDADFAKFGVWQDANSNGVSDAGEFKSLADMGIASLDLTSDGKAYAAANGDVTVHGETGFAYANGGTGIAADASFAVAGTDGDVMSALLNLGAGAADADAPKTTGDLPPVLAALSESNDSNFVDNLVESLSGGTSGSIGGGDASDDALASLLAAHVAPDHAAGATAFDLSQFTAHDEAMAAAAV